MKSMIATIIGAGTLASAMFAPAEAEALKLRLEPSVTFRTSHERVYRPERRVVRRPCMEVHRYLDPYTGEIIEYRVPCEEREVVEVYRPHHRVHHHGIDYGVKFKFR